MMNRKFPSARKLLAGWRRWPVLAVGTLVLLAAAISCRSVNRSVVVLPEVPGAKYIGSKECEQCHDKIYRDFATADHARLIAPGPNAMSAGCESCHGPCSLHSESGGEVKPPNSFAAGRPQGSSFGARISTENARTVETVCFQCHTDVRGQLNLPSHHPVPEGRLTCTECHSPHKGSIYKGGGTQLMSEKDSCVRCHTAQQGPYVFQH
jgi:predicted CXXCH cytochrome family protein